MNSFELIDYRFDNLREWIDTLSRDNLTGKGLQTALGECRSIVDRLSREAAASIPRLASMEANELAGYRRDTPNLSQQKRTALSVLIQRRCLNSYFNGKWSDWNGLLEDVKDYQNAVRLLHGLNCERIAETITRARRNAGILRGEDRRKQGEELARRVLKLARAGLTNIQIKERLKADYPKLSRQHVGRIRKKFLNPSRA